MDSSCNEILPGLFTAAGSSASESRRNKGMDKPHNVNDGQHRQKFSMEMAKTPPSFDCVGGA